MSSDPIDQNPTSGGDPTEPPSPNTANISMEEVTEEATTVGEVTERMEDAAIYGEDDEEEDDQEDDDDDDVDDNMDDDDATEGDDDDDMMSMLPARVRRRVEKLKELNASREAVMQDYLRERAALEAKYDALCRPLYARRADVVKGVMDAAIAAETTTTTDGSGGSSSGSSNNNNSSNSNTNSVETALSNDGPDGGDDAPVGVPQFWVVAMGHMEAVAELVTEEDVDCLEHLVNVTCDDFPDGRGFTLRFHFEPNEYFENDVLTKTYEIPNLLLDDEPILKNVTGCVIRWKHPDGTGPAPCLTHTRVQKRQRSRKGRNAGQIRTVTRNERTESFFHFFNPPRMPSMDHMDEAEADAIEEAFDHDYDVAQAFRSHLVPKGVLWFTGEALDEEINAVLEEPADDDDGMGGRITEAVREDEEEAMEESHEAEANQSSS